MKFKYKVMTQTGDTKVDSMTASSEGELKRLLSMMGQELVEVLEREKQQSLVEGLSPEQQAKLLGAGGVPNMGEKTAISILADQPKSVSQYKEYTDNGIQYRVELNTGKLQKRDWIKMAKDDLKDIAIEDNGVLSTAYAKKLTLYRLEWMDLG